MKTGTKIFLGLLVLLVVLGIIGIVAKSARTMNPSPTDIFAQCLTDKGAKFYGAYWCPHCAAQKRLFGSSVKRLPYVECSTPDGKGQLQICADAGIKSYPTWVFADGTRISGEQSFAELAEKTGCVAPVE